MTYENGKHTPWAKRWQTELHRDTKEFVSLSKIEEIFSNEYDRLYRSDESSEFVRGYMRMSKEQWESWEGDSHGDRDLYIHQENHNRAKRNTTNQVYELYWSAYEKQQENIAVEPIVPSDSVDDLVSQMEKACEEAFESRLYGQTRN